MKVSIGCDHGGFALKASMIDLLGEMGHEVIDHGVFSEQSVNYPDYARAVVNDVENGLAERGILICGPSSSGKSTVATRIVESILEGGLQFCLIDPEGDYEDFEGAVVCGPGVGECAGQPEVRDLHQPPSRHEHVLRFQIMMCHSVPVGVI